MSLDSPRREVGGRENWFTIRRGPADVNVTIADESLAVRDQPERSYQRRAKEPPGRSGSARNAMPEPGPQSGISLPVLGDAAMLK